MYWELSYGDRHIPINKIPFLQFSQGHAMFKQSLIHLESSLTPTLTESKPRDLQYHSVFTVRAACSVYSRALFLLFHTSSSTRQLSPASGAYEFLLKPFVYVCIPTERDSRPKLAIPSIKNGHHLQGSLSPGTLERVAVRWDVLVWMSDLVLAWPFQLSDPAWGWMIQGNECNTNSRWSCHIRCKGRLICCSAVD